MLIWIQQYFGITHRGYITLAVMIACAVALIAWDIYVAHKDKTDEHNTISETLNRQARLHPLIPFAFGVLAGHFFWTQYICAPGCIP